MQKSTLTTELKPISVPLSPEAAEKAQQIALLEAAKRNKPSFSTRMMLGKFIEKSITSGELEEFASAIELK